MQISQLAQAPGLEGLLQPLSAYLKNPHVSEILINRPGEVFVEQEGEMRRIECPVLTLPHLRRLFSLIANENKQILSESTPLLSGNLADGSRVQLLIPPASNQYLLSIRKFTLKSMSMDDYADSDFFQHTLPVGLNTADEVASVDAKLHDLYQKHKWLEFIIAAILAKKTILISGATSSGKTSFLNSCIAQISLEERLIILEDTYEIKAEHQNIVRLKSLKPLGTQEANISMQDLVQASLRLRPDRLIMGEIRGREIFDFVSACSTGHNGSMATIHAESPRMAFLRMVQLYKLNQVPGMTDADIHQILHEIIDVVVQLKKTKHGRRMTAIYYKGVQHVSV